MKRRPSVSSTGSYRTSRYSVRSSTSSAREWLLPRLRAPDFLVKDGLHFLTRAQATTGNSCTEKSVTRSAEGRMSMHFVVSSISFFRKVPMNHRPCD